MGKPNHQPSWHVQEVIDLSAILDRRDDADPDVRRLAHSVSQALVRLDAAFRAIQGRLDQHKAEDHPPKGA